jgi:hypothetical protein
LAKRLILEVQVLVIQDWEAAKCSRSTLNDLEDILDPYMMNVNVISEINAGKDSGRTPSQSNGVPSQLI